MISAIHSRRHFLAIAAYGPLAGALLVAAFANFTNQKIFAAPPASAENRASAASHWPRFRGPNGSGVSDTQGIPVTWSPSDYLWHTPLPGIGHSSPCVWGDHVFLTTALEDGQRRAVLCLRASTGEILWTKEFTSETFSKHPKNSYASATPAADGQRIYVAFNTESEYVLIAYDFEGNQIWKRDLGAFKSQHGCGVSPIVFENTVYLANDQDGPSFLLAVDGKTGNTRWQVTRKSMEQGTSYATPLVLQRPGMPAEIVFASQAEGIAAYDAHTGQRRWGSDPLTHRAVSSPTFAQGLIFQTAGAGGTGFQLLALKPASSKEATAAEIAWMHDKQLPYVPTPVAYGDYLFIWGDAGVVRCLEAATGKNIWTHRLQGNFSGSPVCVNGILYCISEDGDVVVLRAGPEFEQLARNPLEDPSHSTPAIAGGRMFLRTFHHIYCIGNPQAAGEK